jgi:hypothetical protein
MIKSSWLRWCCLGWLLLTVLGCRESVRLHPYERVLRLGDDPAWAAPALDHTSWDRSGSTTERGIFWVRFRIEFGPAADLLREKGLQIVSVGAYEAYWDGVPIGSNGRVGAAAAAEVPGRFISRLALPDSLAGRGEHVLALRVSNHRARYLPSWHTFFVGEYFDLGRTDLLVTAFVFLLGGGYLLVGLYYLLLFRNDRRRRAHFYFGLLCLIFFGLILAEYAKFYWSYLYFWHLPRLLLILALTLAIAVLTPWFFARYFELPRRRVALLGYVVVLAGIVVADPQNFDGMTLRLSLAAWGASLLVATYAGYRRRPGGTVVLGALLLSLGIPYLIGPGWLGGLLYNYDISLFLSFTTLVVSMLFLLARREREQRRAYEASLLRSARLRNELLRKQIQPHFLMNSLTSLMDWVEESPRDGVQFIEALARELSILNTMADEQLVPVAREIELCRAHLAVMRYRKELDYGWSDHGIDPAALLPPAVLHTLVENGITHSRPDSAGRIAFELRYRKTAAAECYELRVHGQNRPGTTDNGREGTGLRYVRARLRESYGTDGWSLEAGPVASGWRTLITLNRRV